MKTKLLSVILAVVLLLPTLGTFGHAQSITVYDILPYYTYYKDWVTVKNPDRPNEFWNNTGHAVFDCLSKSELEAIDSDEKPNSDKYVITFPPHANEEKMLTISLYANGILSINEGTNEETNYRFLNFEPVSNALNRTIITTAPYEYARTAPKYVVIVRSDWAKDVISYLLRCELAPQYMNCGYLTDLCTREIFCDIVASLVSESTKSTKIIREDIAFLDTENENIYFLANRGIVEGKSTVKFHPNDILTREEAATILRRAMDYLEIDLSETEKSDYTFSDDEDISVWAKSSVYDLYAEELMFGVGDDRFAPQSKLTQEQGCVAAYRLYERYIKTEETEENFEQVESGVLNSDDGYQD